MSLDQQRLAVSLFTGAGIGDLGLRAAGFDFVLMAEADPPRADLAAGNFPEAKMVTGDIWETKDQIIALARAEQESRGGEFSLVTCTAPCQGMSKSGRGTLLRNIKLGKRPSLDPRNRLIIPALEIISALKPRWVVFENVPEMSQTFIEDSVGSYKQILEIIPERLGPDYKGAAYEVEFADYGIAQRRRRLITIYTRDEAAKAQLARGLSLLPDPTHASRPRPGQLPWVAVESAISGFPPLDASDAQKATCREIPFHRVPMLDARKYSWVAATPVGRGAFDNQCGECGYEGNVTHGSTRADGVNQANRDTPVECARCGRTLPRPNVLDSEGRPRIMRGFTSAYKRMSPTLPAPTLTRNLSYACSDQKLHPRQNRVLSLAEAFVIHSLNRYEYDWTASDGKVARDGLVRLVLGESIPPAGMQIIGESILASEGARDDGPRR